MSNSTPEGKVKLKLVGMLKAHKVWHFFPANNGFGKAGIPDVIICWYGRFIGVEAKSAKGKPTALQLHVGSQIHDAGGRWFIVRNEVDITELEAVLIRIRDEHHAGS